MKPLLNVRPDAYRCLCGAPYPAKCATWCWPVIWRKS
jgi:hypothetical protein